jgi:hypothetical protein
MDSQIGSQQLAIVVPGSKTRGCLRTTNLRLLKLSAEPGTSLLGAPEFEHLAKSTPRLHTLCLSSFPATSYLKDALPLWSCLRSLSLAACRTNQKLLQEFADFGLLGRLESLRVHSTGSGANDFAFLARLIAQLPALRQLDFGLDIAGAGKLRALLLPERARVMRLIGKRRWEE